MFWKIKLRKLLPKEKPEEKQRVLFIGAHSGDIERYAGGTVHRITERGGNVKFLQVFGGESAAAEILPTDASAEKNKECLAGALLLGVREVEFLPFIEGKRYSVEELEEKIATVIEGFRPDAIFVNDPYAPNELNREDGWVGQAVQNIFFRSGKGCVAFFGGAFVNHYIEVSKGMTAKVQAVLMHGTDFPSASGEYKETLSKYIRWSARRIGWRAKGIYAEGFRIVYTATKHGFSETIHL